MFFSRTVTEIPEAIQQLLNTPGVEEAYNTAEDAAQAFRLHP